MSKWIAEFELEDGDTMPEHMDLEYKGVRVDFYCKPQEPTTKNDLGVDCISRAEAIKCLECDFDITGKENMKTVVNYINSAHDKIVNLPSVTPQEPRTGHWIAHEVRLPDRTILNYRCSVCGRKLIGYSTETLSEAPYCHCGARMVESQESEDKE